MTELNLKLGAGDIANVKLMLGALSKSTGTVIQQAVNRTLTGVRTDATNVISSVITPTKATIRKTMTVKKMTASDGNAFVKCSGKPLNLIHFKARQTQKGVTVQILKNSGRALIHHAFKMKYNNPKEGVTELVVRREPDNIPYRTKRVMKGGTYKWYRHLPKENVRGKGTPNYRGPLEYLYSMSVPDVMDWDPHMSEILRLGKARLKKQLDIRLNYELSKLK